MLETITPVREFAIVQSAGMFRRWGPGKVVLMIATARRHARSKSRARRRSVPITGAAPCKMTPYVTSASDDLAAKSDVTVNAAWFAAALAGQSVTTFVDKP